LTYPQKLIPLKLAETDVRRTMRNCASSWQVLDFQRVSGAAAEVGIPARSPAHQALSASMGSFPTKLSTEVGDSFESL
jgi:hypothetical protein